MNVAELQGDPPPCNCGHQGEPDPHVFHLYGCAFRQWHLSRPGFERYIAPAAPSTLETRIIISKAVTVAPGDQVLLILPERTTAAEMTAFKRHLHERSPTVDWILVAGVEDAFHRQAVTEEAPSQ